MNRQEAYRKAMVESVINSEMWLKEAKIIAKEGSKGHAQALVIFSEEELGKAMMCWLTINGVFPYNHWEVDFRNRNSMFRKHPLKIATSIGFTLSASKEEQNRSQQEMIDPWTGEPIEFKILLAKIGAFVTYARSSWMYVDIKQTEKGVLEVSSPLKMEPYSVEDAIEELVNTLQTFKNYLKFSEKYPTEFGVIFQELREEAEKVDEKFPTRPEWD